MTSSNKVKGFAAGVVAAVCYGTNPLGTLELYGDGFNSSSVLIYRYLLAVLMFAVVMLFRKESFKVKWGHLIRLGVLGCMFSLSSATLYVSFHYMAAGIASTILFVYPIMTAILMTVFFHEKVTWSTSLAILLAVSGVGLLYQGDGNDKLSTAGFALVMCSSLLYALYIISVNQWIRECRTSSSPFTSCCSDSSRCSSIRLLQARRFRCCRLLCIGSMLSSWRCCQRYCRSSS